MGSDEDMDISRAEIDIVILPSNMSKFGVCVPAFGSTKCISCFLVSTTFYLLTYLPNIMLRSNYAQGTVPGTGDINISYRKMFSYGTHDIGEADVKQINT